METSAWESMLEKPPAQLTKSEIDQWVTKLKGVALSSDAFFPFRDNVDRARQVRGRCEFIIAATRLNIKTVFPRYGDSRVKDKTVVRPSYY